MSFLYKVVLIGESDVGKSSTFIRFRDQRFIEHIKSTIGLDSCTREITFNENESGSGTELMKAKIQLWDTAGFERAGRMTNNYYTHSKAVIFMYDASDSSTLNRLRVWHEDANMYVKSKNPIYFMVGNKCDLSSGNIEVKEETAVRVASSMNIPKEHIFRISAKTGVGLKEMFEAVSRVLSKTTTPVEEKGMGEIIMDRGNEGGSSSCCGN